MRTGASLLRATANKRRWRSPVAKPGELKAAYGKLPDEPAGVCYAWGGYGARDCDAKLLHNMLSGFGHTKGVNGAQYNGYLAELEARGYDLTTLKFSIQRKKEAK